MRKLQFLLLTIISISILGFSVHAANVKTGDLPDFSPGQPTDRLVITRGLGATSTTGNVTISSLPTNPAPSGDNNSLQYKIGTVLGGYTQIALKGIGGWISPFFSAANGLYEITNGMEVDPRFFGAACNTQYFNSGYYSSGNNFITTNAGSAVASIANYTPNSCTAAPGNDCDNGKVFSMFGTQDVGPTWIATSTTSPLTVISSTTTSLTLATALQGTNTPGDNSGFDRTGLVLGGYGGKDDTSSFESAIWFSAPYHGGKIVVPPNCLIHGLTPSGGGRVGAVWLAGNDGATSYGNPAVLFDSVTPLYISSNGYAEDPLFGIDVNNSLGFKMTNISIIGTTFPGITFFTGLALSALGSSGGIEFSPHGLTTEGMSFSLLPVAKGVPLGMNRSITLNGQVAPGTNILTVNSTSSTVYATTYGNGANPGAKDWVVPGQILNGAGVPANTVIKIAISYLGGQTTGATYALSNTIPAGVLAETMTTSSPSLVFGGEDRYNQYYNVGLALNGDLSDFRDYGSNFTAAPIYVGPSTSGSGNAANSFYGERMEDISVGNYAPAAANALGAITLEGSFTDQFNGIFCQFNQQPCFLTRGTNGLIEVTGGIIEGNGTGVTPNAQIVLGGTVGDFSTVGTLYQDSNFAFGGTSSFLAATLTGATVTNLSIEGGSARNGFSVAPFDFSRAAVASYKLDVAALPKYDTTIGYSVAATNCAINTSSGGAYSGSVLASVTTSACKITLTLPKSIAGQSWDCAMHDTTSGGTPWAISATTSTSCTGLGATNTGDRIQFEAR